jgi:hypothetical protein
MEHLYSAKALGDVTFRIYAVPGTGYYFVVTAPAVTFTSKMYATPDQARRGLIEWMGI